jgi:hypothetical protein
MNKQTAFEEYSNITNHICTYNGVQYLIINEKGDPVTSGGTNEEIYSFILGYLSAYTEMQNKLKDTITRYEKIISDMGGETLTD